MTHIVLEGCINCKYTDCVEVCPVDCFYEGPNFLVINPDECIDCGVCIPECPVHAIVPDNFVRVGTDVDQWAEINKKYSQMWPVITKKKEPMPEYQEWIGKSNKIDHLKE